MTQNTTTQPIKFVGNYMDDLAFAAVACILSGQNGIFLGAPGWGKTDGLLSIAEQMAAGHYSFTRIDPSTPAEALRGPYNPAKLLNGVLERVVDGTPYDPNSRFAILDEIGRGNEVLFDAALDVTDRKDRGDAPVLATTNFMPTGDRQAALIDRFAVWFWVQHGALDVAAVATAQLLSNGKPQVDPALLPTWEEVEQVRSAVPGPKAIKAISEMLTNLSHEATVAGFRPHPRRVAQWSKMLYRLSVYITGDPDFAAVPDKAARILRYCWPALAPEDQATWAEIAANVIDKIGAAIEKALADVLDEMQKVSGASPAQRTSMIPGLATMMQSTQATLETLAPGDKRVAEAIEKMNTWLSLAVQGKPVE